MPTPIDLTNVVNDSNEIKEVIIHTFYKHPELVNKIIEKAKENYADKTKFILVMVDKKHVHRMEAFSNLEENIKKSELPLEKIKLVRNFLVEGGWGKDCANIRLLREFVKEANKLGEVSPILLWKLRDKYLEGQWLPKLKQTLIPALDEEIKYLEEVVSKKVNALNAYKDALRQGKEERHAQAQSQSRKIVVKDLNLHGLFSGDLTKFKDNAEGNKEKVEVAKVDRAHQNLVSLNTM